MKDLTKYYQYVSNEFKKIGISRTVTQIKGRFERNIRKHVQEYLIVTLRSCIVWIQCLTM